MRGDPARGRGVDAIRRSRLSSEPADRDRPVAGFARPRDPAHSDRPPPAAGLAAPWLVEISGDGGGSDPGSRSGWVPVRGLVLEVTMKTLSVLALATAVSAALGSAPVAAQQRALTPSRQFHAVNPSLSLSAPTNSPLQEQMREDYATGLMGAQRQLLQQNPSGLGRQEQEIGRELNGYTPR